MALNLYFPPLSSYVHTFHLLLKVWYIWISVKVFVWDRKKVLRIEKLDYSRGPLGLKNVHNNKQLKKMVGVATIWVGIEEFLRKFPLDR